jgi:hypothetical protein
VFLFSFFSGIVFDLGFERLADQFGPAIPHTSIPLQCSSDVGSGFGEQQEEPNCPSPGHLKHLLSGISPILYLN